MLRGIVRSSLQFRYLVLVIAVALVALGVGQLRKMPVDVLPEFSPPFVEIQTEALGLSAAEVEQMITVPMEQDLLAGVAWLDVIRSRSVPGLSSVVVYFEPGTDLFKARQMVSERLSQAAVGLPHVSKPPTMIQPTSSASRFMIVGMSSQDRSLVEMSVLARWVIGPRLLGVPGVSNVAIWGNRDRQLQVLVDPNKLRAKEVSLAQIIETTGNALWVSPLTYLEASTPGTGGFIDTPNQRLEVWHQLPISSPEDLAQVAVEEAAGLRLGDVATVVEDHQPLIGDSVVNDRPGLMLVVEKLPGMNTVDVTRGVEDALGSLALGMKGIEFDTSLYRPANYIDAAAGNLAQSLLFAAILLVLALFAVLRSWRVMLVSIIVIPLSLMVALLVLNLTGSTLNAMVLAGLAVAVGVVIDDAVVDPDHVARRLKKHRESGSDKSPAEVVLDGATRVRSIMVIAALITLLAAVPVLFLDEVTGAMLRPLATSYMVAVLASMAVALLVTPALSRLLLSNAPGEDDRSPIVRWLQRGYERVPSRVAQFANVSYPAIAVVVVAGLVSGPLFWQTTTLPSLKEPYLTVRWEAAAGTSHPEMSRILARAGQEIRGLPGVTNVGTHVGRAVYGDQVTGVSTAELWVSIDPAANYNATVAAVEETATGYVGFGHEVRTYLQQTLDEPLYGPGDVSGNSLAVRVFGEDLGVLRGEAEKVRQAISGIAGVVDPRVMLPVEEPTFEIQVDLGAAQTHGIKPGDVRRAAATLLSGLQVGALFEEQKVFDVVVWGVPEIRRSLTDVRELLIETPAGDYVQLGDVADVRVTSAPTVIHREAVSPYLDVAFAAEGRSADAVVADVQSAVRGVPFELEYHAQVVSGFAERQAVEQRVWIAAIAALLGIFLLLQAAFRSWRLAVAALLTLPLALVGGVAAAFLTGGGAVSLAALFGLLTVLGIAARNQIMLVNHFQRLEEKEGVPFGLELIQRGVRERIAPITATTLATALVFLPFAIFGSIPGQEVLHPMSIVVLGGLVTSTVLNLLVVPMLYLRFGTNPEPEMEFMPEPVMAS
ncbi:MAG TPA: efflux RND transporter permease subunit [Chloroflexia bacterium]|nr:efflux RND transporter permease subunit [Chloroflexia bacterium]